MKNGESANLLDNQAHGEDGFLIRELSESACLDVVLDGVTRFGGEEAVSLVLETLQKAELQDVDELIVALKKINSDLHLQGGGRFLITTIVAGLKLDNILHIVRAGDSLMYVVREGSIYATDFVEEGRYSTLVTGGLGFRENLSYSYSKVTLLPGDRLMLATDGVTDNLALEELVSVVHESCAPQEAVDAIQKFIDDKRVSRSGPTGYKHVFVEDDRTLVVRFL